jgi:hypothetical protein
MQLHRGEHLPGHQNRLLADGVEVDDADKRPFHVRPDIDQLGLRI